MRAWSCLESWHELRLLFQVADPDQSDRGVGGALQETDNRGFNVAIQHHKTNQDQLHAGKDSESERYAEYLLPRVISEKTAKKHQDQEEPNLHQAHAAIKGKHRRNYPVSIRFATRPCTQDCEQKEQAARPSEYGGS